MIVASRISRRDFLGAFGGGIVVLFGLDPSAPSIAAEWLGYPGDFHAYLAIDSNGRVTVFSSKIEMGQGVMTSLAQMAAEELGAIWRRSRWSWVIPINALGMLGPLDRYRRGCLDRHCAPRPQRRVRY